MCLSCDTAIYTVPLSRIMWHCHLPCTLVKNYVTLTSSLFTCHELCDTDIFPVHLSRTVWHWQLLCSLVTNCVTLTSSLCTCHELCDTDIFPVHFLVSGVDAVNEMIALRKRKVMDDIIYLRMYVPTVRLWCKLKNRRSSDLSFSIGRPRNRPGVFSLCSVQLYVYVRICLSRAVGARPRCPTPSGAYPAVLVHGLWNPWVWTDLQRASSTPMPAPAVCRSGVTTCAYQGISFLLLSQVSPTNPYQELNAPIIENWLPIFIRVEYLRSCTLILDSIEVQSCWLVQSSRKQGALLQVERGRGCRAFWPKGEGRWAFWPKGEGRWAFWYKGEGCWAFGSKGEGSQSVLVQAA